MTEEEPVEHGESIERLGVLLGEILDEQEANSGCISIKHFKEESFIYHQGDQAEYLFYILQGRVRTFLYSEDGREKTVLILGKGDLIGAGPFFLESSYPDNASALDGLVILYKIDREGFDCLLAKDPAVAKMLLVDLATRVDLLEKEIANQSFLNVRSRLQLALVQLADRFGIVTQDGVLIDLHITHEQLAQLVGANRATVSACLSQLQRGGFYQVVDQHIVLSFWAAGKLLLP